MTSRPPSSELSGMFPRTRWSVVLAARRDASPESAIALESICQTYWYPLYAYVRRSGYSPDDAQDLTQEFFLRLLEKHWLESADPHKGKLRTFLIVGLKNLLSKEWRRESAQRRGGGKTALRFDTTFAESRLATDPASIASDESYDQQWALTLLELTVDRLRAEFQAAGKLGNFDLLKNCLTAERGAIDYAGVARGLGVNEATARVAVHRLRKRFREVYREEISHTLADTVDLEGEMRHLAGALARKGR